MEQEAIWQTTLHLLGMTFFLYFISVSLSLTALDTVVNIIISADIF
jgi:hypothetical protein